MTLVLVGQRYKSGKYTASLWQLNEGSPILSMIVSMLNIAQQMAATGPPFASSAMNSNAKAVCIYVDTIRC